jgi:hypothetical protein
MIWFTVGLQHLERFMLSLAPDLGEELINVLSPLAGRHYLQTTNEEHLRKQCWTVYTLLEAFHGDLTDSLNRAAPAFLEIVRNQIQRTARDLYQRPDFECTQVDAANVFSLHKVFAHGSVEIAPFRPFAGVGRSRMAYIPDFCVGVSLKAHFVGGSPLPAVDCHVCDTLWEVRERARSIERDADIFGSEALTRPQRIARVAQYFDPDTAEFWELVEAGHDNQSRFSEVVIDARVEGFWNYRRLVSSFSTGSRSVELTPLLSASAWRIGQARRWIDSVIPYTVWTRLPKPERHFCLSAAEQVCRHQFVRLVPNIPNPDNLADLIASAENGDAIIHPDQFRETLRQLGLFDIVARLLDEAPRAQPGPDRNWSRTLVEALKELGHALFSPDIEKSLSVQGKLDLRSHHKGLLRLVEDIILPRLHAKGFKGDASQLWTNGFLDSVQGPLNTHPQKSSLSDLATLETEGNWLLHAADHKPATASDPTAPIDLAALLDAIVTRMSSASEVSGVSVSLDPATPQVHARQLAALADPSSHNAACMTLYLGKIALILRNAVEHGTARVVGEGLLLETRGYWVKGRFYKGEKKKIPNLEWDQKTKADLNWRPGASLPATLPIPAETFLLTPASLRRCLTLLSLVMRGAISHLHLEASGWDSP